MFAAAMPLINHLRRRAMTAPSPTQGVRWLCQGGNGCLSPCCPFEPHHPVRGMAGQWVTQAVSFNAVGFWLRQERGWKMQGALLSPLARPSLPYGIPLRHHPGLGAPRPWHPWGQGDAVSVLAAGRASGRRGRGFPSPWEDLQLLNNRESRPFMAETVDKIWTLGMFSCLLWHVWQKPGVAAPIRLPKEA